MRWMGYNKLLYFIRLYKLHILFLISHHSSYEVQMIIHCLLLMGQLLSLWILVWSCSCSKETRLSTIGFNWYQSTYVNMCSELWRMFDRRSTEENFSFFSEYACHTVLYGLVITGFLTTYLVCAHFSNSVIVCMAVLLWHDFEESFFF